MSAKVVIVLVGLALVFVALVVWGANRDDGGSDEWSFGTLAGCAAGRAVQGSDVIDEAECFSSRMFVSRPGKPCVVGLKPLGRFAWRHRQLALELAAGFKVKVQLTPSDPNSPSVSVPLSTRMPSGPPLPVLPDGGTLAVVCEQPDITTGVCQVRLARR
jgi:hypothetical protein